MKAISAVAVNEEIIRQAIKDGRVTIDILHKILPPIQFQTAHLKLFKNMSYVEIARLRFGFVAGSRLNFKEAMKKILKYLDDEGKSLLSGKHPTADNLDTFKGGFTEDSVEKLLEIVREGKIK